MADRRRRHARRIEHCGKPGTPCGKCSKTIAPITIKSDLDDTVYHTPYACIWCLTLLCEECGKALGVIGSAPGLGYGIATGNPCGLDACRKRSKPYRLVIEVRPDDAGPVDAEHVEAVAELKEGATLADVQKKLRQCVRPATARDAGAN